MTLNSAPPTQIGTGHDEITSATGAVLVSLIAAIGKPSLFWWSEPGGRGHPPARLGCDSSGNACGVKGWVLWG